MKYKILKGLDIAGLQVFDPVVRLCYGEEPAVQIKKISQFIVVPTLTFLLFLLFWDFAGPRHTTKSGEVPTPADRSRRSRRPARRTHSSRRHLRRRT